MHRNIITLMPRIRNSAPAVDADEFRIYNVMEIRHLKDDCRIMIQI